MFELFVLVTGVLIVLLSALLAYNFFAEDPVTIESEISDEPRIRHR